jgi:uncharacterized protein
VELLDAGPGHVESVLRLLEGLGTAGNLVPDAHIAAATLDPDAVLHTTDADFIRFGTLRWVNPIAGTGAGSSSRLRAKRS